jgi:phosphoadenosine phosphosulfate reductase
MASGISPGIPIVFLETGFHFAETLAFKERLAGLLSLNVINVTGDHTTDSQAEAYGPRLYERDADLCCKLNKVVPFGRALRRFDGWITAMRRDSAWTRSDTPILSRQRTDADRWTLKINPIANWTRRDVWTYLRVHDLPHNPLYDLGYASIGCAPCTRFLFPGEDERAGRWPGSDRTECGIHAPRRRTGSLVASRPKPRPHSEEKYTFLTSV